MCVCGRREGAARVCGERERRRRDGFPAPAGAAPPPPPSSSPGRAAERCEETIFKTARKNHVRSRRSRGAGWAACHLPRGGQGGGEAGLTLPAAPGLGSGCALPARPSVRPSSVSW